MSLHCHYVVTTTLLHIKLIGYICYYITNLLNYFQKYFVHLYFADYNIHISSSYYLYIFKSPFVFLVQCMTHGTQNWLKSWFNRDFSYWSPYFFLSKFHFRFQGQWLHNLKYVI